MKPRNTINDKDWRGLQDRARRANAGDLLGDKETARRKAASENLKNRDKN